MKKVLLTINNSRLSGIEMFTLLLSKYIDKSKYNVIVGIPTYGPFCKTLEENEINYFIFNNKINEKHSLSGILFLLKNILKNKYDIIHAQAGIVPCLIGKLTGTELVIEHKHGLDFTSEQIENMNIIKMNYEKLKKYFVNFTFTGCEADKRTLIKKFNYSENKVKVIYNGLEENVAGIVFKKNKKFTIGTIGRLTYQKAQEYFIQMAGILTGEGYDFEYHIYGEGELYNFYFDLIGKNNLSGKVILKGYTSNVSQSLKTFDVFVLPSRYEGIPYVLLEAMKEGVPIITTNVGGINEVIVNMKNGILVKKENAVELTENIKTLFDSKDLREKLIKNALKDFKEKYTIEKTIKEIESVYSY